MADFDGDYGLGSLGYGASDAGWGWAPSSTVYQDFGPHNTAEILGLGEAKTPTAWDVYRAGEREAYGPMSLPPPTAEPSGGSDLSWLGNLLNLGQGVMGFFQSPAPNVPQAMLGQVGGSPYIPPSLAYTSGGSYGIPGGPMAEAKVGQAPQFLAGAEGQSLEQWLRAQGAGNYGNLE